MRKVYTKKSITTLKKEIGRMDFKDRMYKCLHIRSKCLKAKLVLTDIRLIIPIYAYNGSILDELIIHTGSFSELTIKATKDLEMEITDII